MVKFLYAVLDRKCNAVAWQFFDSSDESAMRSFTFQLARDPFLSQFPEDFALYRLADLDLHSMELKNVETTFIMSGSRQVVASVSGDKEVSNV